VAGGGDGTRTHDPLVANQVLYQLSYAPVVREYAAMGSGTRFDPHTAMRRVTI